MATYNDEGVVLRTRRLGEADRIVTILSRDHGKIRGVAKGVRRASSKVGARAEPFAQIQFQVIEARTLDIVSSVVTKELFGSDFLEDYGKYTAAEAMVEVADHLLAEEGLPARQHYFLLVGALRSLARGTTDGIRPPTMIMDSYMLRAVGLAGYTPALDHCAICGNPCVAGFFHPASGGLLCPADKQPGSVVVSAETLAYVGALISGDWPHTHDVPNRCVTQASGLIAAFVQWHLGRPINSLAHVDRQS